VLYAFYWRVNGCQLLEDGHRFGDFALLKQFVCARE